MSPNSEQLQRVFEAAIMVAGRPLTPVDLQKLFAEDQQPSVKDIREILATLQTSYNDRGIELKELASGFQFQAKADLSPWLSLLWEERAPRYSRAILETIALIAYRQPITRAEIEEIRGVSVSTHITKTLLERDWVRVVGHRDVPGKPALYGTTKNLLDHLNLKSLDELPTLAELKNLEIGEQKLQIQLELSNAEEREVNQALLSEVDETNTDHELAFEAEMTMDETIESLEELIESELVSEVAFDEIEEPNETETYTENQDTLLTEVEPQTEEETENQIP